VFYRVGMPILGDDCWPKHVWVCVTGRWGTDAHPGILTQRRQVDGRWEGYVIAAHTHSTGGGVGVEVRQGWHRAEHIRVAEVSRD
jgi:hypothetical protein